MAQWERFFPGKSRNWLLVTFTCGSRVSPPQPPTQNKDRLLSALGPASQFASPWDCCLRGSLSRPLPSRSTMVSEAPTLEITFRHTLDHIVLGKLSGVGTTEAKGQKAAVLLPCSSGRHCGYPAEPEPAPAPSSPPEVRPDITQRQEMCVFSFVTHLKHIHFNYICLFIYLSVRGWICLYMHLSEDTLRELVLSFHPYVLGIQFSSSGLASKNL